MPRYDAIVEFRRRTTSSGWVIAGVSVGSVFWPAEPGVEAVRARLPTPGLVGWADIGTPILAPDLAAAAATALELARVRWPGRARRTVPWAAGVPD